MTSLLDFVQDHVAFLAFHLSSRNNFTAKEGTRDMVVATIHKVVVAVAMVGASLDTQDCCCVLEQLAVLDLLLLHSTTSTSLSVQQYDYLLLHGVSGC